MKTSRLEKKVRALADEYMAVHPGTTRQEAKRRVRGRAQLQLSVEDMRRAVRKFAEAFNAPLPHTRIKNHSCK